MNNLDQLFVRACKAKNPSSRINSIYRRFYLASSTDKIRDDAITSIFLTLCEKYDLVSLREVVNAMHPLNMEMYSTNTYYWSIVRDILTSYIRLSEISKFKGLATPRRYK